MKLTNAIKKTKHICKRAYELNIIDGEGDSMIAYEFDLTKKQVNKAIRIGERLSNDS